MRRRLLVLGVVALLVTLAVLAADVCEYCNSSPPAGSWIWYYQCKSCYQRYCEQCQVQVNDNHGCPKCKSVERNQIDQLRGY